MVPSPATSLSQPSPVTQPRVESPCAPSRSLGPALYAMDSYTQVLSTASHGLDSLARHPELEQLASTMPSTTIDSVRSQSRMSISHAKGLLNYPGQNNCFLNSAVQVLWHLDTFRRSFRELHGHACMGDSCIFCALKELFNQFQSSKESALPPDSLRFALAEAFSDQHRFQMGFMDDAAECFENILLRIHYHLTNQEVSDSSSACLPHCITHQKFAMNLYEQIVCHSCGASSEPFVFSQMVHYASTTALCSQEKLFKSDTLSFGSLLKMATSMGDIRNCPKLCGTRISIKKVLVNQPEVISVCLVWDSEHATLPLIRNVFQLIETSIRLHEVFDLSAPSTNAQLNLVGLVTYYGKHYSTYLYNTSRSEWVYFDDATVRVIGPSWQQVVDKCLKARFQPLLLLYSNPTGSVVNTQYAFTDAIPMTAIKKQSSNQLNVSSCPAQRIEPCKTTMHSTLPKQSSYTDVPDSPSATSTTSYFSDVGDSTDGYISRKAVENILKIQQHKQTKEQRECDLLGSLNKKRNSSSSIDSFDYALRLSSLSRTNGTVENNLACLLQRRDSGNSSGDRSSSVSSVETPYYRRPLKSAPRKPSKHNSDQGYDSFSLSSTDSYPSNYPPSATSPSKLSCHTLKQIPEDVQLLEVIHSSTECDQLCSEVDILLIKSGQMEREGDLRAAAALSDSAAAKARIAMDAPYSNHQTLISAKMKHSICVMRSTSLHKRVQEMEEEERRHLKAAQEYHHSRQSSRDSNHGRHSRQGSRDSKDPSPKTQAPIKPVANVEIYATLPKKTKRKSLFKTSNGNLTQEVVASLVECPQATPTSSFVLGQALKERSEFDKKPTGKDLLRESDFSDYYSEWEGVKKKSLASQSNGSGWQSCRENESEVYGEIGLTSATTWRKQCKVKRKLLLGGLLKSKNRSMPDLREDSLHDKDCERADDQALTERSSTVSDHPTARRIEPVALSVANINAKGFHQSHRSFVTEHGLCSKPALVKVKPPLIMGEITSQVCKSSENESIYANLHYEGHRALANLPTEKAKATTTTDMDQPAESSSAFLLELNQKRRQILKRYETTDCSTNLPVLASNATGSFKKPSSRQIATFISTSKNTNITNWQGAAKYSTADRAQPSKKMLAMRSVDSTTAPVSGTIQVPIPIHATCAASQHGMSQSSQSRPNRPPDYETALRRIEMRSANSDRPVAFPVPPPGLHYLKPQTIKATEPAFKVPSDFHKAPMSRPLVPSREPTYRVESSEAPATKGGSPKSKTTCSMAQSKPATYQEKVVSEKSDRRRVLPKKSVKFSDHIELVACADDNEVEEHLPNPLLEKVLSNKSVVYTLKQ